MPYDSELNQGILTAGAIQVGGEEDGGVSSPRNRGATKTVFRHDKGDSFMGGF